MSYQRSLTELSQNQSPSVENWGFSQSLAVGYLQQSCLCRYYRMTVLGEPGGGGEGLAARESESKLKKKS